MSAVSWGESPIERISLNGEPMELAFEENRFFYIASPLYPAAQNNLSVVLDRSRTQYSKLILAAQVFGIEITF